MAEDTEKEIKEKEMPEEIKEMAQVAKAIEMLDAMVRDHAKEFGGLNSKLDRIIGRIFESQDDTYKEVKKGDEDERKRVRY